MVDIIRDIVKSIVDDPERVQVSSIAGRNVEIIEVDVDPSDRGKVIGRQGSMAEALRTVLRGAGGKNQKTYSLEIIED